MKSLHPLLLRQLRRLGMDPEDPDLQGSRVGTLLARVSRAYEDADKGQYLLRRAQELSSTEMGQLYEQLMDAQRIAGLGNWSFDLQTGTGHWSEECARLLGVDPGSSMPELRSLLARVQESSRRPLVRAVETAVRDGNDFEVELRLMPHDGHARWICVAGRPIADGDGGVQRLHGTVMGITRRKQTELRQGVEHTVAQILAEAQSPADAMPRIIATVCAALGWCCGAYWRRDRMAEPGLDVFHRSATWSLNRPRIESFLANCGEPVSGDGEDGLIVRAARLGEPVWIDDVTRDDRFTALRAAASAAGIRAAFAFPIDVGGTVAGVVEFFDRRAQQADEGLLESARSLGRQIGQYLQRKQVEDHVHQLAFHDPLTNLPNRAMFNRQLSHAIAQAARHDRRLAVLFIDLDRFKVINDTLGHDAGDRLLQEMARRLAASLRQGDLVSRLGRRDDGVRGEVLARLGGDEFVVLIEDVGEAGRAAQIARKLLAALLVPYRLDGHPVHITASIGVSLFPEDGLDERTLMKHADIAMYRTKDSGKNSYQFYAAQMNPHSSALLALESDLRFALQRHELRIHYQAKFDLATGRVTGSEALVRWQHPSLGLMAPEHFIPLAEETGLIVPLGKWVLEQACAQNCAWIKRGLPPLRIAVNLSARQFSNESLLDDIAACLSATGMDPGLLELEITESTVMHNPDKVVYVLDRLKQMGARVAIDDFGVGYSSLAQLKRLPIDVIKVDRSFIQECPDDFADVAITRAVIAIGKSLNLQVVAEGVETARHLRFVRDSGCNEIQGYFLGRPSVAEDFLRFYEQCLASPGSLFAPAFDDAL